MRAAAGGENACRASTVRQEDRLDRIDLAEVMPHFARLRLLAARLEVAVPAGHRITLLQDVSAVRKRDSIDASLRGG